MCFSVQLFTQCEDVNSKELSPVMAQVYSFPPPPSTSTPPSPPPPQQHDTLHAVKRKMWEIVMNPHVYKVYTKVIGKTLQVLPSKGEFDAHEVFPGLFVGDVS